MSVLGGIGSASCGNMLAIDPSCVPKSEIEKHLEPPRHAPPDDSEQCSIRLNLLLDNIAALIARAHPEAATLRDQRTVKAALTH